MSDGRSDILTVSITNVSSVDSVDSSPGANPLGCGNGFEDTTLSIARMIEKIFIAELVCLQ